MDDINYIRAGRYDTPATDLYVLSQHPSSRIRIRVAENQATPQVFLEELSTDSSEEVRIAVGGNTATPLHVVMRLAFDEHVDVRFSLAENYSVNVLVLLCLANDENPFVSHRALTTLKRIALGKRTDNLKRVKPKLREFGVNPRAEYRVC
jgi:hypothetical protein